mmetsp:Transcript_27197/g.73060  ORF Transcript_27197/g.73060 Transcript_27197/m.73060 type:complete len:277 (-) Transcript_27197:2443-3273(-)
MSASCRALRIVLIVDPCGSSSPPTASIGSSCFIAKWPVGESTAATLRMSCSPTGKRSMRDVIRVSTEEGHSILPMSQPSTSLIASCDVSSTPCSSIDCRKPFAKKGLPPERVVIVAESVTSTRPLTQRKERISSSMSGRVSSESFSASPLSDLSSGGSSELCCGRLVRMISIGFTRSLTWQSSCHDDESIQCTSSNMSSECMPPSFAASTWHITLIDASLRASPDSCFVNSLSGILIGRTGLRRGAWCNSVGLFNNSSSACGRISTSLPNWYEPGR